MSAQSTMIAEFAARERLTASANAPVQIGQMLACSTAARQSVSRTAFKTIVTVGARTHIVELVSTPRLGVPFNAAATTTYEQCRDRAARLRGTLVTELKSHFTDVRVSEKPLTNVTEHTAWKEPAE